MAALCRSPRSEPGSRPRCAPRGPRTSTAFPNGRRGCLQRCVGAGAARAAAWLSRAGAQQAPALEDGAYAGVLPAAPGRVRGAVGLARPVPGIAAQWGCVRAGGQDRHERKMLSPADPFQWFPFARTQSERGGALVVRGRSLGNDCVTGSLCSPTHEPCCSLRHSSAVSGSPQGHMQPRRDRSHLQAT